MTLCVEGGNLKEILYTPQNIHWRLYELVTVHHENVLLRIDEEKSGKCYQGTSS